MPSILLSNYYTKPIIDIVKSLVPDGFDIIFLDNTSKEDVVKKAKCADYFIVGGRTKIDAEVIGAAPKLKMIQRTGVGLDAIDLEVLKANDIPIYLNKGINSQSVAEHTLMLILSITKNLSKTDALLKAGIWKKHEIGICNYELKGKTVGLVGLGSIGLLVAKMLKGFGVTIIYYKRNRLPSNQEDDLGITYMSFEHLLNQSDIVSLHCPHTKNTEKLIGKKEFSMMKKGSFIINTSRGTLIDEQALIRNLKSGHLKAAGLDVYEQEPISKENELLKLENVILTPHISGITHESYKNMISKAFDNIVLFDEGKFDLVASKKIV